MAEKKGFANFLGNLGQSLPEKVLGGFLGEYFNERAANRNIQRMQRLGLTPQEMVGGSAGGGMSASPPVLGNVPAMQAAVEQREREKDRELERERIGAGIYQTETQAKATLGAAETAARASMYGADVQQSTALAQLEQRKIVDSFQVQQIAAQTDRVLQDTRFEADLHDERWERLFATMGPENVMASTMAVLNGVDIESVLKGVEADQATKARLRAYIRHVTGTKSHVATEMSGAWHTIGDNLMRPVDAFNNIRRSIKGSSE